MGFLTALAICTGLIGTGFAITDYFKREEKEARLQEQGKDPETLAKNQLDLTEKTATENLNLQKEQFNYQKELNDLTMQREDTAMQRQVADLKAAGLSPLMLSGGASANPLTSATAPQFDVSGINQAIGNMIGAYNDSFNRKMMKRQFGLQTAVSTAEAYTKLSELSLQKKRANLENAILSLDYNYYKNHPERNLGLQQVLLNLASRLLNTNGSALSTIGSVPGTFDNPLGYSTGTNNPSGNALGARMIEGLKNPRSIAGNLGISIPSLKKKNVINDSDLKKDTDFLQAEQNKNYKLAINAVETRANKKDEKLLKAIDFLWNNSTANDYFLDKESFKNKVLTDSSYRKNIAKNLKLKPYKNPFEY